MHTTVREHVTLPAPQDAVFEFITSEEGFLSFRGFGPIPGLRSVQFDHGDFRTVGSVSTVTNTDGSTHRERVTVYEPSRRYAIQIDSISSPFRLLMDHAEESWLLTAASSGTAVERMFRFVLRTPLALPLAVPIAQLLFRQAVRRHHADLVGHVARRS